METFVHVVRTEYNFDSAVQIGRLFEHCAREKSRAVALADKHSLHYIVEAAEAARKHGVKAIYGAEFEVRGEKGVSGGLLLFAKNEEGFLNLQKLSTQALTRGGAAHAKKTEILECSGGLLAAARPDLVAGADLREIASCFPEGDFYALVSDQGMHGQKEANLKAEASGFKLLAWNDVRYLGKGDAVFREILVAANKNREAKEPETSEAYFKTGAEMEDLFAAFSGACANTAELAEKCQFELKLRGDGGFELKYPEFPVPDSFSMEREKFEQLYEPQPGYKAPEDEKEYRKAAYLCRVAWGELLRRYPKEQRKTEPYRKRAAILRKQLGVILSLGFSDYFLIIHDFIKESKRKGIAFGPGRGSAVAAYVAELLGITEIDPVEYGLLFERFLNAHRKDDPDMDIDVEPRRRHEVVSYIVEKYGKDRVARIVSFDRYATKNSVQFTGKALKVPESEIKQISGLLNPTISLEENLRSGDWKAKKILALAKSKSAVNRMLGYAMKLQGIPRNVSTHGAGIVVSNRPFYEVLPMLDDSGEMGPGALKTQLNKDDLPKLGFLKIDLLPLRNVEVLKQIKALTGVEKVPLNDQAVLELYRKGDVVGVFQMDSQSMRDFAKKVEPASVDDLIALVALHRPGPKMMLDIYAENKRQGNRFPIDAQGKPLEGAEDLADILRGTYGVLVYQEQIMQIAAKWSRYSMEEADAFRSAVSKKKKEAMEKEKDRFVRKAAETGRSESVTERIFEMIERFAEFGFGQGHSTAYAVLSYETAWFKKHHSQAYMACLLTSVMENTVKCGEYIAEARRMGIDVLPPDINESGIAFEDAPAGILFGLPAIKNVGFSDAERIVEARAKKGRFSSLADFLSSDCGRVAKKAQESLARAGAFDGFGSRKSRVEELAESAGKARLDALSGGDDMLFSDIPGMGADVIFEEEDYAISEKAQMEAALMGVSFSGAPRRKKKLQVFISDDIRGLSPEKAKAWIGALADIMRGHPGEDSVYFRYKKGASSEKFKAEASPELLRKIDAHAGAGSSRIETE